MGVNGIYGLSGSGIDVESMVKVGMMSKQNEYDKMAQKFTKNEWIKADYLELNNKITTFNSSTLSQYKMSNTMNARTAESSSEAVKVMANSTAPLMNHRVEVSALSSNAYLISTGDIERYGGDDTSIQLKDILFQNFTVDSAGENVTYKALKGTDINGNQLSSVFSSTVSVNDKAISFYLSDGSTKEKDADGNETIKNVEISLTFKEINEGATLNDLVSKINSSGLNVKAAYDSVNDRFSIYNKQGGTKNTINIKIGDNESGSNGGYAYKGTIASRFLNNLKLYQSKDGELISPTNKDSDGNPIAYSETTDSYKNSLRFSPDNGSSNGKKSQSIAGENGVMKVDGVTYNNITDNKVTVNGVTYTALNTTTSTGAATVSVSQDTDAIMDKVKSFVSEYNTLLSSLYAKYDEKPNSDYKPLTQAQKDQMKEEQITKWEEKAKAGLLYHDATLGKVIMNMRSAVSETVDGIDSKYNSIYSLGISTTGIKGQLVLDEDKLKTALANDPDAVYNVFAKLESTTTNSASAVYKTDADGNVTSTSNGNGIAQRLGDIFVNATKLIKDRAGSSADITEDSDLNNLLRNLQTKMSNFKRIMNSFEDALYKKYDAMESTLAKLGMQLNYVMGSSGQ